MKTTKAQAGITLIALIITIIVLLILAIVTINAVKDGGIINYAQRAKNDYERGADEENTTLGGYLSLIESNIPGGNNLITNEIPGGEEETIGTVGVDITAEINSTINGEAYSSTNPIIPAGFIAINTETSRWDAEGGPQVDNGLVITDGTNEFVWVPVISTIEAYGLGTTDYREPDVITGAEPSETVDSASGTIYDAVESNLTLAGCTQDFNSDGVVNAYDFKIQLTNEFEEMEASVNKYGGFYVGRYETSINNGTAQSIKNAESATALSSSGNTWYGLYAIQKTYNTSSVKSSMIWGSQYNAMMTWIGDAANTTIGDNRNTTRKTGSVETDKIKNVYDLYGNSGDWTIEAYHGYFRVPRGGDYLNDRMPSLSDGYNPTNAVSNGGSRLALYIV